MEDNVDKGCSLCDLPMDPSSLRQRCRYSARSVLTSATTRDRVPRDVNYKVANTAEAISGMSGK